MELAEGAAGEFQRDASQQQARILGRVIPCDGSRATIAVTAAGERSHEEGHWSVGKLISVSMPNTRTVGLASIVERMRNGGRDGERDDPLGLGQPQGTFVEQRESVANLTPTTEDPPRLLRRTGDRLFG